MEELKEKRGSKYTVERLNAWAHMINMGKHSSKDDPPNLPFFGKRKTKAMESTSVTPPTSVHADGPSKRVGVRTQCIHQLTKWHELLKSGAISPSQYEELKGTILKDMSLDPREGIRLFKFKSPNNQYIQGTNSNFQTINTYKVQIQICKQSIHTGYKSANNQYIQDTNLQTIDTYRVQ